ncbi:protein of unknown function [Allokutzneria albata]|uniref:HNH nuclease domain-containing protein n=2 Tax=Allokutzneria albata TaxID=211114 RepID=A0A1G9RT80_ALLAB|nr:protein of unknown function [Allokutzneria albata]
MSIFHFETMEESRKGVNVVNPKALIHLMKHHLAQADDYKATGDGLVERMKDWETLAALVLAAATDTATEAESQGLHTAHSCKNLAVLLRSKVKLEPAEAQRRTRLVHELPKLPATRERMYAGEISGRHALVISDAVKRIPSERREEAEQYLARVAPTMHPRDLMLAGKYLRSVLDPDGTFRDEQEAVARRELRMASDQDGSLHVKGVFPLIAGQKMKAVLDALAKPRTVDGEKDPRTAGQRYADAFEEVIDLAMATGDLPETGGRRPTVVVTMDFERLLAMLGSGSTATGDRVSAGLVRQMCCEAGILPTVLGGGSEPLDLGRERRTASVAQRKALAVRDKGCAFPGCDRPPGWTEAHHVWHWIDGGPTDLGNLVLLCVYHHHVMHAEEWRIVFEQGIPSFIPPRWIDVEQKPLRNIRVDYPLTL